jgi:hypothetical protein
LPSAACGWARHALMGTWRSDVETSEPMTLS